MKITKNSFDHTVQTLFCLIIGFNLSIYSSEDLDTKNQVVVGSDYNSLVCNPEDEITYSNYRDAVAAVILEMTEEDTGFIDSMYFTDSVSRKNIMYLENGLSNALQDRSDGKYIKWIPFNGTESMPYVYESFEKLMGRYNLMPNDIGAYCLSQFALANIKLIQNKFDIDDEKIVYVGDRFGYTGTSSPFLALHEGIESGRIKRGDHLIFWTIGAGYQIITML
ncbi:3-oxoacyl-[acyl-carrier-protein] synthase III C-terminal domain-containing protein [Bacillus sp. V33-4]|uniref:3-oxoacyl-[acyl-carrier-protein] synthase III C-terminal domain-containing protein n=1 Tax=Bacillus sp. V33-4 TaxID=2054169 RepID=UPI0015E0DD1A|nr:3-oxoacyl-[acyl-carrier-protein] synthase III C-terminal domain-containing protein [Bacillus sp. V33-4]